MNFPGPSLPGNTPSPGCFLQRVPWAAGYILTYPLRLVQSCKPPEVEYDHQAALDALWPESMRRAA